ncbi:MAG: hypothetical protein FIB07_01735 [Candidatus Methanoperedens sp.]|nr:hypothetical protein [Candidatus Methanoperedens sp.]
MNTYPKVTTIQIAFFATSATARNMSVFWPIQCQIVYMNESTSSSKVSAIISLKPVTTDNILFKHYRKKN